MIFDNYLFHPSSLGTIMTASRDKDDPLGETCKKHLIECYIEKIYGRKKDITSKYLEKGIVQEEESITLYSLVTKKFHKKNIETITNDYFIGTPDLFEGKSIREASQIIDIKTSWDIFTFFAVLSSAEVNKNYQWQLQAYMDLTGATGAKLVYCLVDTPLNLINDAKRKLQWAMGVIDPDANPEFLAQCEQIEKNMTFQDIPKEDRYISFEFRRDQKKIDQAYLKLEACREFLNNWLGWVYFRGRQG